MPSLVSRLALLVISRIYQVTGASGFVGSHVVDELLRNGYSVRRCVHILTSSPLPSSIQQQYTYPWVVVSAVRSHNVERVSKSYASFGDRFTTTVIEDLATSDLSPAVKGVDAIIHVASPLSHASSARVILDVRIISLRAESLYSVPKLTINPPQTLFLRAPSLAPTAFSKPLSPPA